ncbi:hypothetical protein LXL04_014549 [Taraxacum kok-saghyz]
MPNYGLNVALDAQASDLASNRLHPSKAPTPLRLQPRTATPSAPPPLQIADALLKKVVVSTAAPLSSHHSKLTPPLHRNRGTTELRNEVPGLIPTSGQRSGVQPLQNPIWVPLKLVPHVGKFSLETPTVAGVARFAELELGVLVEILRACLIVNYRFFKFFNFIVLTVYSRQQQLKLYLFAKFMEQRRQGANQIELEVYLSDGMEKRVEDFNILGWWRLNSVKFPVLSEVVKLVLAMPISTVASESIFLDIQFKQITTAILEEQLEILAKIELGTYIEKLRRVLLR